MTLKELRRKRERLERDAKRLTNAAERLAKLAKWARGVKLKALAKWLSNRASQVRARRAKVNEDLDAVERQIRLAGKVPEWLPVEFADDWRKPWTVPQSPNEAVAFKRLLWDHGYVSPHYTRREAGGQDRHPLGCPVPDSLRLECQYHAFGLERVRHELGDRPMGPLSWYRCPPHNAAVGGASASQHMKANATDWGADTRANLGGDRFDAAMERVYANGGRGYQGAVGGPIRHVDNGPARTWVYA